MNTSLKAKLLPFHTSFLVEATASATKKYNKHCCRYTKEENELVRAVNHIGVWVLRKQQQLRGLVRDVLPPITDPNTEDLILQYLF